MNDYFIVTLYFKGKKKTILILNCLSLLEGQGYNFNFNSSIINKKCKTPLNLDFFLKKLFVFISLVILWSTIF